MIFKENRWKKWSSWGQKIQICFRADILITMAYNNNEGIFKTCLKGIYKMSGSDKKNYLAIEYLN